MKKLLESETRDEKRRSQLTLYILNTLLFALFVLVRTTQMSVFQLSFFLEFIFIIGVIRFYSRAHQNKNYALWGFSAVIAIYVLLRILHFTFITYDILVLYVAFLTAIFLSINSYLLGSPLYFPRVQWWEYDFRYRGDLKAVAKNSEDEFEIRVADIRRSCLSFLSFEKIVLGDVVQITIPLGEDSYSIQGRLKTLREDIPGRPIRYGIVLSLETEDERKSLQRLKKMWKHYKKANLRRKFSDYKDNHV